MTNPEAVAWLEEQIALGEGAAASGGWLPSTGPGFSAPEGLYDQMTEFVNQIESSWDRVGTAPIGSPNPEPVEVPRLTREDVLRAYDIDLEEFARRVARRS